MSEYEATPRRVRSRRNRNRILLAVLILVLLLILLILLLAFCQPSTTPTSNRSPSATPTAGRCSATTRYLFEALLINPWVYLVIIGGVWVGDRRG